jgi:hypothetical protein
MCSGSAQPARPSSTRPPLIASTWATAMAGRPGSRKVAEVTSVPSRMRLSPGPGANGDPRLGRPGPAVAVAHPHEVVGAEEGVEAVGLGGAGDRDRRRSPAFGDDLRN